MKPILKKALPQLESSFIIRKDVGVGMKNNWHYHAEYELLYMKKSAGVWLIGDYVGQFKSGDVILLGPNIPHSFRHEEEYITEETLEQGEALVALFSPEVLGQTFLNLPEFEGIRNVLLLCKMGLKIKGETRKEIGRIMEETPHAINSRRLINLLYILQLINEWNEFELLVSNGYVNKTEKINDDRLNSIFQYTFYNFNKQITIEEVAAIVNMGPHSFCRFFKRKTYKTYIQFLMEVRIGHACKLLVEENLNASEIAYMCGYNSISHFNHQFKIIKNKSPLGYKRDYLNLLHQKIR